MLLEISKNYKYDLDLIIEFSFFIFKFSNSEPTPKSIKVRHCEERSNLMMLAICMLRLLPLSCLRVAMTKTSFRNRLNSQIF